MKRKKHFW